ncbi:MAG: OmpA family protein [candidate division Zixibacteria bacterium]|nr:OmpA family protein [Candidatus Tariuqbacter arcticus]
MNNGRRKKKEEEPERGTPGWMVTYGDMMTLLLTFFILIVSFSSIQKIDFDKAMGSLRAALGLMPHKGGIKRTMHYISKSKGEAGMEEMLEQVIELKKEIAKVELQKEIKVTLTDKGAHIVISDPLLFDLGSDKLKGGVIPALDVVANLIKKSSNTEIIVEGHTDNWPINNERFPSNWELSAARALAVVKYFAFRRGIDPARFAGTGYGEYRPIKPNDTPEHRAMNRRVEIYVNIKSDYTTMTPEGIQSEAL